MRCRECNAEMFLDDVVYNFRGNYDNYWLCNCGASCIEQVRFFQSFKEFWLIERGNVTRSYEIKKPIEAKFNGGKRNGRIIY